ncbi:hypothetical protein EJ05DRAFT_498327 [Pseudovirgaria hyperparasitica]|uniref:Uncharacterized protein n=1 Tax=Pseudovirgaria hyperparasitica TaxID=470096 RepID=A0A6A6WEF0_9PEZI|nr:uncharacterized protein EJ05DRAFT_498327 [Pseudovirgaria hyperparasitica]KAF2760370.1 hypothetical protein EJ05DRAFT_498327 [Pseudovirgaria hyperparasitica]
MRHQSHSGETPSITPYTKVSQSFLSSRSSPRLLTPQSADLHAQPNMSNYQRKYSILPYSQSINNKNRKPLRSDGYQTQSVEFSQMSNIRHCRICQDTPDLLFIGGASDAALAAPGRKHVASASQIYHVPGFMSWGLGGEGAVAKVEEQSAEIDAKMNEDEDDLQTALEKAAAVPTRACHRIILQYN